MTRLAILAAVMALPAYAEVRQHVQTSYVSLSESSVPDAVARVVFNNSHYDHTETAEFTLTHDGIPVRFIVTVGNGGSPDRVVIIPPDGYVAIPDFIETPDGTLAESVIFPVRQVGM